MHMRTNSGMTGENLHEDEQGAGKRRGGGRRGDGGRESGGVWE